MHLTLPANVLNKKIPYKLPHNKKFVDALAKVIDLQYLPLYLILRPETDNKSHTLTIGSLPDQYPRNLGSSEDDWLHVQFAY